MTYKLQYSKIASDVNNVKKYVFEKAELKSLYKFV